MKAILRKIAQRVVPNCPRCRRDPYRGATFSQGGEDCILKNLFDQQQKGFFVDVGAHHPKRFSNTYLFYERGWTGINIDPIPGTRKLFTQTRPLDVTLECGVGTEAGEIDFYIFDEPAYNSFNKSVLEYFANRGFPKLLETRKVPVFPLSELLDKHLPPGQTIDFLSVDAEGWDLKVLESNNWSRYKPRVVVVEDGNDLQSAVSSPVAQLLAKNGYRAMAKTMTTVVHVLS